MRWYKKKKETIDDKIIKLMDLTESFIFIEYYTHTNEMMYKILNPYTKYKEEKLVLCYLSDGIKKALDLAYEEIDKKKKEFFNID